MKGRCNIRGNCFLEWLNNGSINNCHASSNHAYAHDHITELSIGSCFSYHAKLCIYIRRYPTLKIIMSTWNSALMYLQSCVVLFPDPTNSSANIFCTGHRVGRVWEHYYNRRFTDVYSYMGSYKSRT